MTTETVKTYTIDAAGKRLGKIATEAATVLMGKNDPSFAKHTLAGTKVEIINASKMDISDKKNNEIYQSYSGYPGGRKIETLSHLAKRQGFKEVLHRTIAGMLPGNKLKKPTLAQLTISE